MFNKILIIGCGLIGSSVLRACLDKKISKQIYIYENSKKYLREIKKISKKIIILKNLDKSISNIDFIIICTPMSEYSKIFKSLKIFLNNKTLITEVGSTKKNILRFKDKFNLIPSHPIAGSEVSGPEHGNKNLFKKKWCILININKKKLNILKRFWGKLGSKIVLMNVKEHDKIFSITSHLPHLIAYNLIKTAQEIQKKEGKNIVKFSAGGLRDFSRTAASNEIMWRDIFFNNKKNMINVIDIFIKNLLNFKRDIKYSRNKDLIKTLKDSKKVRKKIIKLKQDVSIPDFGRNI